jgi:Resolvase, N terminal domain
VAPHDTPGHREMRCQNESLGVRMGLYKGAAGGPRLRYISAENAAPLWLGHLHRAVHQIPGKDRLTLTGGKGLRLSPCGNTLIPSTASGRCFLAIMEAIAQMERELKAEWAAGGRAAAKARGRTGGRPRTDPDKLEQAWILYLHSDKTAAEVCRMVGIGRRTLFSYLMQVKRRALPISAHEP